MRHFKLSNIAIEIQNHIDIHTFKEHFQDLLDEEFISEENLLPKLHYKEISSSIEIKQLNDLVNADNWGFSILSNEKPKNSNLEKLEFIAAYDDEKESLPVGLIVVSRNFSMVNSDTENLYSITIEAIYTKPDWRGKGIATYLILISLLALKNDLERLSHLFTKDKKLNVFFYGDWDSNGGMHASLNLFDALHNYIIESKLNHIELEEDMGF